ncbi:MAG: GGDEF domain-containing protein, partial [Syntrophomonadaceae bacterium]|nr:GGDEF domain-containing protein [Syntrophomonadaceae bacterium]
MITRASDIMVKDFITVDALDGLRKVQNFMLETGHNYFIVMEGSQVKGILNSRNLIKAHPNRLAIDALSTQFEYVSPGVSLWAAKEKLEKNNCEILLVKDEGGLKGFITEDILNTELAKYFDPLTNLYRSEYIYHQGIKLISKGEEISIVFIDINNFGQINKKYGHIQGNLILKELGNLLKSNIPEGSFLCRFGGDE